MLHIERKLQPWKTLQKQMALAWRYQWSHSKMCWVIVATLYNCMIPLDTITSLLKTKHHRTSNSLKHLQMHNFICVDDNTHNEQMAFILTDSESWGIVYCMVNEPLQALLAQLFINITQNRVFILQWRGGYFRYDCGWKDNYRESYQEICSDPVM